jgi:hypothetical protein
MGMMLKMCRLNSTGRIASPAVRHYRSYGWYVTLLTRLKELDVFACLLRLSIADDSVAKRTRAFKEGLVALTRMLGSFRHNNDVREESLVGAVDELESAVFGRVLAMSDEVSGMKR